MNSDYNQYKGGIMATCRTKKRPKKKATKKKKKKKR
jgi:hypothetical protein